ncbi:GNAT family N-acetyltransferase [Priestia endophytica]|uniref:GNAT family N-acetyltransferase n=1 Tax=Priestia endophytica TaxID=135735 RepID=UPI0022823857|nr:GNAT family N-acetyltransferase [Priestia endophytica]MCY8235503.1 GNAT family N-acetyltransferase [Priestia endophytica]
MEIRNLNTLDAREYRKVRLESLKKHPESFGSSYEEEKDLSIKYFKDKLSSPESFTFGAFDKHNELIGIVTLKKEYLIKLRHRANITAMYVSPLSRKTGIGRKLIATCIEKAKTLKEIEQIYLTVVTTNIAAKNLYSTLGFKSFSIEKRALKLNNTYIDEEHMVLYIKQ